MRFIIRIFAYRSYVDISYAEFHPDPLRNAGSRMQIYLGPCGKYDCH